MSIKIVLLSEILTVIDCEKVATPGFNHILPTIQEYNKNNVLSSSR